MSELELIEQATNSIKEAAEKSVASRTDTLQAISEAAQERFKLLSEVESLNAQLEERQNRIKQIEEEIIPGIMDNVGIPEVKLPSGHKVSVSDYIFISIPKASEDEAFSWLEQNNHGDIIKNELSITFGKEENEKAIQLKTELMEEGYDPKIKRGVHPSILRAFAKEQQSKGVTLPATVFSTWVTRKAVIK